MFRSWSCNALAPGWRQRATPEPEELPVTVEEWWKKGPSCRERRVFSWENWENTGKHMVKPQLIHIWYVSQAVRMSHNSNRIQEIPRKNQWWYLPRRGFISIFIWATVNRWIVDGHQFISRAVGIDYDLFTQCKDSLSGMDDHTPYISMYTMCHHVPENGIYSPNGRAKHVELPHRIPRVSPLQDLVPKNQRWDPKGTKSPELFSLGNSSSKEWSNEPYPCWLVTVRSDTTWLLGILK